MTPEEFELYRNRRVRVKDDVHDVGRAKLYIGLIGTVKDCMGGQWLWIEFDNGPEWGFKPSEVELLQDGPLPLPG